MRSLVRRIEGVVEKAAEALGTVQFLFGAMILIAIWVAINGGVAFFGHAIVQMDHGNPFDPAPFILLNLLFSFEAFFSASLIIIAQKAQARRAHAQQEANAVHRAELAQSTHEHILRLEQALLDHMLRVEAILVSVAAQQAPRASQEPRRGDGGENPSPPPSEA